MSIEYVSIMETFLKESKAPRIKEERKKLGLTQAEMAERCGVKRLQWVRYEKGEQDLSGDVLVEFGKQGADITYVLTGTRTPKVETQVLDKVSKAKKTAQATGNETGAKRITDAKDDMLADMIRRGENAKIREDELRQITLMLCDLDDEQFEQAYQAISDIHSNKQAEEQQIDSKNAIQVQQTDSNNNVAGNTIGNVKNATIGSNNISHSFNQAQGGWTDVQFIFAGAVCAISSLIFLCIGDNLIYTQPHYALTLAILMVIGYALTAVFFMLGQTTSNVVPSKRKKALST